MNCTVKCTSKITNIKLPYWRYANSERIWWNQILTPSYERKISLSTTWIFFHIPNLETNYFKSSLNWKRIIQYTPGRLSIHVPNKEQFFMHQSTQYWNSYVHNSVSGTSNFHLVNYTWGKRNKFYNIKLMKCTSKITNIKLPYQKCANVGRISWNSILTPSYERNLVFAL